MVAKSQNICRRLVLFLDGTWNLDDEKGPATNIVRMREMLSKGLVDRFTGTLKKHDRKAKKLFNTVDVEFKHKGASGMICDGFEYLVYYSRGVGTGALKDQIKGGITGDGLDVNMRQAYNFLSYNYRPGDEIFVFGFSRGAFTARSLCGYLHAFGLLKRDHCTKKNEEFAWSYYRTPPHARLSGEWRKFQPSADKSEDGKVYERNVVRVRCLGLFDTVGALGIPLLFKRRKKLHYQFHNTSINSLVDISLHALAIDEWRWIFESAAWTKPKYQIFDPKNSPTEQVWFAGAHGDVGGGYVDWKKRKRGLSDIPITWMIQRVNHHLANSKPIGERMRNRAADATAYAIRPNRNADLPFEPIESDASQHTAEQHRPWWYLRGRLPLACRLINQHSPGKRWWRWWTWWIRIKGEMVHEEPIGEMIHISALERLGKRVLVEEIFLRRRYRPRNLVATIPDIISTYRENGVPIPNAWKKYVPKKPRMETLIVDWDGRPLKGKGCKDRARDIIKQIPKPSVLRYFPEKTTGPY